MAGLALAGALTAALVGCGRQAGPASTPPPAVPATTSESQPATATQTATASTPDPVDSIDQLVDQAEQDADSVSAD